ncbi:hypothetical protein H0H81_005522 [Sphagnurus paluster]|uniref:Uncharacterized protein n=1 Tax=Sphagnurus paluster TaxID=117069 RepID=A0A9P7GRU8_9AGAR|nr:hypothetical protein H0H81_005522 [Sphagnurus paluster]
MSEVEPQIFAPTIVEAMDQDAAQEFAEESAEESADTSHSSVFSPHAEHEAEEDDHSLDVISNAESAPADSAEPETAADGLLPSVSTEATPGILDGLSEIEDKPKSDSSVQSSAKPLMSVKPTGKLNGGPPTPLVKKIINSGTFGAGTTSKPPLANASAPAKSSAAPVLKKSTSSAPPSRTLMPSSRTPAASAVGPTRRQSVVPAKPSAPAMSKSISANAKPASAPAKSVSPSTKPPVSTSATRASVVSPTGSVTSASSRPRASVSEGVKRAPLARQSVAAGTKPPLGASSKRSATISVPKSTRTTPSISSIKEVKEDGKVLEELQSKLKEANDALVLKNENVIQLENRVVELKSSLENTLHDFATKVSLAEQLEQEKTSLEIQLSQARNAVVESDSVRERGEVAVLAMRQDLETARATSVANAELIDSLRNRIQDLQTQLISSQETLDIMQNSGSSDTQREIAERESLLKAQTDLDAMVAENEALKAAHAIALQTLDAKLQDAESKAIMVDGLAAQIAALKEEKEENSGKVSELEIEVLELKESQEAVEDERERLSVRVKALEDELLKAISASQTNHDTAKARELEVAAEIEALQKSHAAALRAASDEQERLSAALENLQVQLATALAEQEQVKTAVSAAEEEHACRVQEIEQAHSDRVVEFLNEIKNIKSELENQEAYYNSKLNVVKEEHVKLLQEEFERAKTRDLNLDLTRDIVQSEAADAHAQELQGLRAGSSASIEQIQAANRLALADLKAEHTALLESEVTSLKKIISTLKTDLKATQDDLAKAKISLEAARMDVTTLTEQRDEARSLLASAPNSSTHVEEVARLSQELSNTKDDLNAVTEMLNLTKVSLTQISNNQTKDLEDAAKARADEVTKLRSVHDEEIAILAAQKSELSVRVSDLEGELATLKATVASERMIPKVNGNSNGAAPPTSPSVTKEDLQKMHEAHNLKIYDLEAAHARAIKALSERVEASEKAAAELNLEIQRKTMEIQYLEQDQEESQEQITRLKEDLDTLTERNAKEQATAA